MRNINANSSPLVIYRYITVAVISANWESVNIFLQMANILFVFGPCKVDDIQELCVKY